MSTLRVTACLAALTAVVFAGDVAAQRQGGAGRAGGRGNPPPARFTIDPAIASIVGQVVVAGSGTPIRGAEVRVRATDGRENRLVTTDAEGRFAVRDLTAGEWSITASKAGFISQQFGQRRPNEAPRPVSIAVGARVTARLELIRAGAITGHVYDEFGDPVAGARVQALRSRMLRGRRQLANIGVPDQTDDTGAFRIYALAPGDYYVGASLRLAPAENLIIDAVGTLPTYFPGTPNMSDALRVTLGRGEEQSNVNISIQPVRAVRVSGTLLTSTGVAPVGQTISLVSTTDFNSQGFPVGAGGTVGAGGFFTIANVAPGNYALTAFIPGDKSKERGMEDLEQAYVPITVGTENVTNVSVTTSRGGTVTANVIADNGSWLPGSVSFSVTARSEQQFTERSVGILPAGQDRVVRVRGLFGTTRLFVTELPDGWMLKSIDVNGTDVTDAPFEIRGENLTGRIVLTDRVTAVTGTVRSREGIVADARVIVFPADSARWNYLSRFVRVEPVDNQGGFTITKLPPDQQYLAVAVDYLEDEEFWDPDFLERMKPRASSFSLYEGEKKSLDLQLLKR